MGTIWDRIRGQNDTSKATEAPESSSPAEKTHSLPDLPDMVINVPGREISRIPFRDMADAIALELIHLAQPDPSEQPEQVEARRKRLQILILSGLEERFSQGMGLDNIGLTRTEVATFPYVKNNITVDFKVRDGSSGVPYSYRLRLEKIGDSDTLSIQPTAQLLATPGGVAIPHGSPTRKNWWEK